MALWHVAVERSKMQNPLRAGLCPFGSHLLAGLWPPDQELSIGVLYSTIERAFFIHVPVLL